jgi:NDP-sugar pyrophosphorylase family protein
LIETCDNDYILNDGVAVHKTAVIEQNVVLKPPVLIGENVSVGANAYVRGPVLLDKGVHIGAGCEIKQSMIFSDTAIAHFNYIGNSIIGSNVNFEAGSIAANHFNERDDKIISVVIEGKRINTGVTKFGALVGDGCRIGANAVLSPGTILRKNHVVKRLELIEQK